MLQLPDFSVKAAYIRMGAVSLGEGLEYIRQSRFLSKKRRELMGVDVGLEGNRLATFLYKGITCITCGRAGNYFAIERCRWGQRDTDKYHLNLWGINNDGSHFLMTSDHIVPKSKGGGGRLENRQPMCSPCNCRKGNMAQDEFEAKIRKAAIRKEKLRERIIQ